MQNLEHVTEAGSSPSERDRLLRARIGIQRELMVRWLRKHALSTSPDERNLLGEQWAEQYSEAFGRWFEDSVTRKTLVEAFERGMTEAEWLDLEKKLGSTLS